MKICIATTAFPRWQGDFRGIFVFEAARALASRGCEVKVVAMHNPGAKTHEFWDGIEIVRPPYAPENWEILQKDSAGIPSAWKSNLFARLLLVPFFVVHSLTIAKQAKDCDVIHANWTLSAISAWAGYFLHRRSFLVTVQGSDIFQASKFTLIRLVSAYVLRKCWKIVALSKSLARETAKLAKIPVDQIIVLPNGVNLDTFSFGDPERRENILLFVGSFIKRKGGEYLIEALHMVIKKFPHYKLMMIGEGSELANYQHLVRQLNLQDHVEFIGTKTQTEIGAWMRRSRLFILPSLEEGQGVVFVEAMASGLPCIGTRVGGIPDVVNEEVGSLVAPGNAGELAQAILKLLEDPIGWQAKSILSRKRAESLFDWDRIAERLEGIYHQMR